MFESFLQIHFPCQSASRSSAISNVAGSLQSDALPCLSHTRTRQKHLSPLDNGLPLYGMLTDLSDAIRPLSHLSAAPASSFDRLLATMIRYALCICPRVFDLSTQPNLGLAVSIPRGSIRYSQRSLSTAMSPDDSAAKQGREKIATLASTATTTRFVTFHLLVVGLMNVFVGLLVP